MENIDITLQEPAINNIDSVLSGPPGPQGEPGEPGRDGVSPTINIGTVTTLDAGSPATVENVGSSSSIILDFGIPQGEPGVAGEPGADGADGADGVSPTIEVGTTSTLSPGSQATVTNVGTDSNVILNFGIPQGAQGDTSGCLSVPTVVSELPEVGNPNTFYFVPKPHTLHTGTGNSFNVTISDEAGRFEIFSIRGVLEQATPPATIYVMTGTSTITIGADTYTLDLGTIELAKVNSQYDYIYKVGDDWVVHKVIGKIESYDGEQIDTDYICTSGTLTAGDTVYYVLDEPINGVIGDTNLIDTLNEIYSTIFETGTTAVSITNADVTPDLAVAYYGYDPNNQYDKYVYIIDTSNWEKI